MTNQTHFVIDVTISVDADTCEWIQLDKYGATFNTDVLLNSRHNQEMHLSWQQLWDTVMERMDEQS